MALTSDQIKDLMQQVGMTCEHELNCNECLDKVAEFAECELAGKPIPEALESVQHHLELCADCREEYNVLLTVLRSVSGGETRS